MGFVAPVIGAVAGGLISANSQKKAAEQASNAQVQASQASIDEQQRQFDTMRKLLDPYVNAGNGALSGQQDLLGLNGYGSQQDAINNIQQSPFIQSMYKQAENALLQNASATGGLRGGNIQSALADNRMNILYKAVQDQNQNLGALTSLGQNAAAGVGNQGMNMANNIGSLLTNQGQAQAGYALAKGQANQNMVGTLLGGFGMLGKSQGWF